ncbi:MAG TPA: hypothetical protein VLA13_03980 [Massilibacterium sp.]|nr:hypothetical protein [Massilibacterium sp.]
MKKTKEIGYELLRVVDMDGFMELWNRTDTKTKDKIVNGIGELAVKLVNEAEQSASTCNLRFVIKRANLKRIPITSWLGLIASILMLIYALRHVL